MCSDGPSALAASDNATWTGSNSSWSIPANWSHDNPAYNGTIPNSTAYNVNISSGVCLDDVGATISSLYLSGSGSLGGGSILTLAGGGVWSGGAIGGSGTIVNNTGQNIDITGPFSIGRNINNNGTITWSAGTLTLGTSSTISNVGTFLLTANATSAADAYAHVLNNSGTLSRTSGTGSASFTYTVNNTGTISCSSGSLVFTGGGVFSAGTITAGSNATISFTGSDTHFTGGAINGGGTILFGNQGNNYNWFDNDLTINTTNVSIFSGAHVRGAANLTVANNVFWGGGYIGDAQGSGGTFTIASGGSLSIQSNQVNLQRQTLVNNGVGTWSSGIFSGYGGVLKNVGTFNVNAFNTWSDTNGGYITNSGTLAHSGGQTNLNLPLNNSGTVIVNSGTLALGGGGTSSGAYNVNAATLAMTAGVTTFTSGASLAGSGTFALSGYVYNTATNLPISVATTNFSAGGFGGTGTAVASKYFNWTGGTVGSDGGTLQISSAGSMTMNGSLSLSAFNLRNDGTIGWSGGSVGSYYGSVYNNGTFNATVATAGWNRGNSTGDHFDNAGTFNKSGSGSIEFGSVAFNNSGTVNLSSGTLILNQGFTDSGTYTIASGATLSLESFATSVATSSANFAGSGAVLIHDANLTLNGGTYNVGTTRIINGNYNGNLIATAGTHTTVKQNALMLDNATFLDLNDNKLLVSYITLNSPVSTIRGYLVSGRNSGSWNGYGIRSSSAAADPTHVALGYADTTNESVAGVSSGNIYVKYTYNGDANLDGKVDIADLGLLATNYGLGNKDWYHGDFNYDGSVNIADLGALATNYGAGTSSPLKLSFEQALAEVEQQTGVQLPEPHLALLLCAAPFVARRRCS